MDTDFYIDSSKCHKCYKCVKLCTEKHKESYGKLGFLKIDTYDGVPENIMENPICHHCIAEIDNVERKYPCNYICEHNAIKITRW